MGHRWGSWKTKGLPLSDTLIFKKMALQSMEKLVLIPMTIVLRNDLTCVLLIKAF